MTQERGGKTEQALFSEIGRHLLLDGVPSLYLKNVCTRPAFERYPFRMLLRLRETEQSPVHHPEGSVWNHTLLVVDEAAGRREKSRNAPAFMWAALLHDIGKPPTMKLRNGRITAYGHDAVGERLSRAFLSALTDDRALIESVAALVRYHMHVLYIVKRLPFADVREMMRRTDLREVALLGLCDRLGRGGARQSDEEEQVRLFLALCSENGKEGTQDGERGGAKKPGFPEAQGERPQDAHSRSLGSPAAQSFGSGKNGHPKQSHDEQLRSFNKGNDRTGDALMPKNYQSDSKKSQNQKNNSPRPIPVSHDNSDQNKKVKKSIMDSNVQ